MMRDSKYRIHIALVVGVFLVFGLILLFVGRVFWGAPEIDGEEERFVVQNGISREEVFKNLSESGFVKHLWAFRLIHSKDIAPGAYRLSKDMGAFEVSRILSAEPYMKWVIIPEGLRKEEIAEILGQTLGWSEDQKKAWLTFDTEVLADYKEGVYFPDTYLMSTEESTAEIAERLRSKFEEKFAPFAEEAIKQNIKWTTAVKIASIVEREAAGDSDKPLVAGILWNRLLSGMRLEVDATLQYMKGSVDTGWWPIVRPADKQIDSPYNTYKYAGLPPTPISNPGVKAFSAVFFPEETDCLFYLHDEAGEIHCAITYDEHLNNIEAYLK